MEIIRTGVTARHPWPEGMFIQGGGRGLVLSRTPGGDPYRTAFVEAFPDESFIRGEGATVEEAEDAAWAKYQRHQSCPDHEWESRGYVNGAGFCRHCKKFKSGAFTPEQLGLFCDTCGAGTFWTTAGGKMFCEDDAPSLERRRALDEEAGIEKSALTKLLEDLAEEGDEDDELGS
ncbi:hypothetical protein ACFVAJ_16565 [Agromyces sp. NPDC057679]|uniref:hypothetical protein n=1 Tax=Agromyces sp. NPDC057679 TaxID=3346207 RepID=UPI00366E47E1